jgi:hypothetical protein
MPSQSSPWNVSLERTGSRRGTLTPEEEDYFLGIQIGGGLGICGAGSDNECFWGSVQAAPKQ